jgi:hypothetical protein
VVELGEWRGLTMAENVIRGAKAACRTTALSGLDLGDGDGRIPSARDTAILGDATLGARRHPGRALGWRNATR